MLLKGTKLPPFCWKNQTTTTIYATSNLKRMGDSDDHAETSSFLWRCLYARFVVRPDTSTRIISASCGLQCTHKKFSSINLFPFLIKTSISVYYIKWSKQNLKKWCLFLWIQKITSLFQTNLEVIEGKKNETSVAHNSFTFYKSTSWTSINDS